MTHDFSRPLIAAALGMMLAASPAFAGNAAPAATGPAASGGDRMNLVIIYGNDACPVSTADEITVCARKDEAERYRIPAPFREQPSTRAEAWTNKVIAYERVGATGAQSCSPVGAGGWTGCAAQFINNAAAEKKAGSDVQFSQLLDKARAERQAKIDEEAAKTQSDVEDAERAYEARQRAAAQASGGK